MLILALFFCILLWQTGHYNLMWAYIATDLTVSALIAITKAFLEDHL